MPLVVVADFDLNNEHRATGRRAPLDIDQIDEDLESNGSEENE